jgi:hypothetical protein
MKLPALAATLEVAIAAGLETTSSSLGTTASERQTQVAQTHVTVAHEHDAVATQRVGALKIEPLASHKSVPGKETLKHVTAGKLDSVEVRADAPPRCPPYLIVHGHLNAHHGVHPPPAPLTTHRI